MPPAGGVGETAGQLIGVIGDEETVTGMLLAGVGEMDNRGKKNFYVVTASAPPPGCPFARGRARGAPSYRALPVALACSAAAPGAGERAPAASRARRTHPCSCPTQPPLTPACGAAPLAETTPGMVEEAFHRLTARDDVAILLINQYVASMIRETIDGYEGSKECAVLEIPSKEHPYDPEQDAIHRRTKLLLGIRD